MGWVPAIGAAYPLCSGGMLSRDRISPIRAMTSLTLTLTPDLGRVQNTYLLA